MTERRQAVRVKPPPEAPVEVQINGPGFVEILRARDISIEGIGVCVPHEFKGCDIDKEVAVIVTLPEKEPFMCAGLIRHRSPAGPKDVFGVAFTEIAGLYRSWVEVYVENRLKSGAEEL